MFFFILHVPFCDSLWHFLTTTKLANIFCKQFRPI